MEFIHAHITIPYVCNMRPQCPYCVVNFIDDLTMDVGKWSEGLLNLNKYGPFKFEIANGEPFYNINLINIIKNIPINNTFEIASNIIAPIDNFILLQNTSNINVACSFHPEYWNKHGWIQAFSDKMKLIAETGISIYQVNIVAYPPYLLFLRDWVNIMEQYGILLYIIHFSGYYNGKLYPQSYDIEDLKLIDDLNHINYEENINKESRLSYLDCKGHLCYAGSKYVYIMANGQVWSCYNSENHGFYLGSIFENNVVLLDKPKPCPSSQCGCEGMWNSYVLPLQKIV